MHSVNTHIKFRVHYEKYTHVFCFTSFFSNSNANAMSCKIFSLKKKDIGSFCVLESRHHRFCLLQRYSIFNLKFIQGTKTSPSQTNINNNGYTNIICMYVCIIYFTNMRKQVRNTNSTSWLNGLKCISWLTSTLNKWTNPPTLLHICKEKMNRVIYYSKDKR